MRFKLKGKLVVLWVACGVGALLMGLATWRALTVRIDLSEAGPKKRLGITYFEDLAVSQHGLYGVHLVKCKSCRMEKRRLGLLSLGAFNVVRVEGLDITLPPPMVESYGKDTSAGKGAMRPVSPAEVAEQLGIGDRILKLQGATPRFSGLEIDGLSIARADAATNVVPRLRALHAKAVSEGLDLRSCVIFDGGSPKPVERASMRLTGSSFRVEWPGGSFDI